MAPRLPAIVLTPFLLVLLLLSYFSSTHAQVNPSAQTYTADAVCFSGQDFCLTGIYSSQDQTINYTMIVAGAFTGWRGVGQGRGMRGANMLISWINNNDLVLSHRSAPGETMPTEALAISTFTPETSVSRIAEDKTIISWTFPQTSDPGAAMRHIWAARTSAGPASSDPSSPFSIHNSDGLFSMDFTKAYTGEAPAVPSGATALPAWGAPPGTPGTNTTANSDDTSGSSSNTGSSGNRDPSFYNNRVWLAHLSFMIIGWLFLVPAGILVARFGRLTFKWFPYHRSIQLAAVLFILIGFFLAVGSMANLGWSHFSEGHHKMGLAAVILLVLQGVFGQFTHVYKRKVRASGRSPSRILGAAHALLGILTFALAIATIHSGFEIWEWWGPPGWASTPVFVWAGVLGAVYLAGIVLLLPKELRTDNGDEASEGEKVLR